MGVAVKVTAVPEQTGLAELPIKTLTGIVGFTIMLMSFEVAGFPMAHELMPDVRMQLTTSLFAGIKEYEELFTPTFVPFTFHW